MVGQKELLKTISEQVKQGTFPRFSIFVGELGTEKNEFAEQISNQLHANYVRAEDCKVDTIRNIILESYLVKTPTVYSIPDADAMSVQARNALLKVTEEPPNKAYFVMTLEDENNTLPTIKSRGVIYKLQPYTRKELEEYCHEKYVFDSIVLDIVLRLCENPGEIDLVSAYNPHDFYLFVEKVVDNITSASGSNVFKIAQSIKFKDADEQGYDLKLFWIAFSNICLSRKMYSSVAVTNKYLGLLYIKSLNRQMLFDRWILDIREDWNNGYN